MEAMEDLGNDPTGKLRELELSQQQELMPEHMGQGEG